MANILSVGLGTAPPQVMAAADEALQKANDAGYHAEGYVVESDLSTFQKKLQERKWDAVNFGFGIRGVADHTEVFEKLVNMVAQMNPAPKLVFSTKPDGFLEAVQRVLK